jgi:hypothetical protein
MADVDFVFALRGGTGRRKDDDEGGQNALRHEASSCLSAPAAASSI